MYSWSESYLRNDSIIESDVILKDIHGSTIFLRNIFLYFEILFLLLIRYLWILDYIFFLASLQLFPTGKQIVPRLNIIVHTSTNIFPIWN